MVTADRLTDHGALTPHRPAVVRERARCGTRTRPRPSCGRLPSGTARWYTSATTLHGVEPVRPGGRRAGRHTTAGSRRASKGPGREARSSSWPPSAGGRAGPRRGGPRRCRSDRRIACCSGPGRAWVPARTPTPPRSSMGGVHVAWREHRRPAITPWYVDRPGNTGHPGEALTMARPTAMDEHFVHQIPELLPNVVTRNPHWRESYFFDSTGPTRAGDVVFFTMAHYPARELMDSLQMGRVGGEQILGAAEPALRRRPAHHRVPGARVEVVRPWEELHLWADPDVSRHRPRPHVPGPHPALRAAPRHHARRRRDGVGPVPHPPVRAPTPAPTRSAARTHEVDGWIGQRDHSWGIRDHGRCPLWMWFQLQFDDGFLGVWHWELANGARIYTDGCWAGTDGSDPVPVVDFRHDMAWIGRRRRPGRLRRARRDGRRPGRARARSRSPGGRAIDGRGRGHASTGPTSRSTAAGSARCACGPTTAARAPPSTRSPAPATTATSPTPSSNGVLPS